MVNASIGNFFAGALGAFSQARKDREDHELKKQFADLQAKLLKNQIEQQQRQESARTAVSQRLAYPENGVPFANATEVQPKPDLLSLLADPQMVMQLQQGGMLGDITDAVKAQQQAQMLGGFSGGVPQAPPGFEVSRIGTSPSGPIVDFRPVGDVKNVIEDPSTGARFGVDAQGRPVFSTGGAPGGNLTPAQKKVDEHFAQLYTDWTVGGGASDVAKMDAQLQDTLAALEAPGSKLTGPIIGQLPDNILAISNPDALQAKEQVQEVVQRNLRKVLGPQFTAKEGEGLINRAYNPSLPPGVNAQRLRRLIAQVQAAANALEQASQYYEQNGTLQGYRGKTIYSMDDFEPGPVRPGDMMQGGPSVIDFKDLPD